MVTSILLICIIILQKKLADRKNLAVNKKIPEKMAKMTKKRIFVTVHSQTIENYRKLYYHQVIQIKYNRLYICKKVYKGEDVL